MIRLARKSDLSKIMQVIEEARAFLKENSIPQWQGPYPNEEIILKDISQGDFYVLEEDGEILAIAALDKEKNPSYEEKRELYKDQNYYSIHRIAVANSVRGKGYAKKIFEFLIEKTMEYGVSSIRVDTHEDNKAMRSLIDSLGFSYVAEVILAEGDPRLAYEKILDRKFGVYLLDFDEMTGREVYNMLKNRQDVFVLEQQCIYDDMDNKDQKCKHLLAKKDGEILGSIRLIPPGVTKETASLGRFCVIEKARGLGIGGYLFDKAIEISREKLGREVLTISAQAYLKDTYAKRGFVQISDVYLDEGIEHVDMRLDIEHL